MTIATALPALLVGGTETTSKNTEITVTAAQVEELGKELDALRARIAEDLGERDRDYLYSVIKAQRGLEVAGRGLMYLGFLPPVWLAAVAALCGCRRSSTTWRSATTSCTVSTTGCVRPGINSRELRVGHGLPGRSVAALAQLHASHVHQHRRHGSRCGLRHPAHGAGAEVESVLPGQPGLGVGADGALRVGRHAARPGDRERHPAASASGTTSSRS
jgi:hypothetical protein